MYLNLSISWRFYSTKFFMCSTDVSTLLLQSSYMCASKCILSSNIPGQRSSLAFVVVCTRAICDVISASATVSPRQYLSRSRSRSRSRTDYGVLLNYSALITKQRCEFCRVKWFIINDRSLWGIFQINFQLTTLCSTRTYIYIYIYIYNMHMHMHIF